MPYRMNDGKLPDGSFPILKDYRNGLLSDIKYQ